MGGSFSKMGMRPWVLIVGLQGPVVGAAVLSSVQSSARPDRADVPLHLQDLPGGFGPSSY